MSKTNYTKCSIFLKTEFLFIFINFCTSAPINVTENAYTQFIAELNRNECSFPSQVQLPFDTTKKSNFEYLSSYLEICQNTKSSKRNKEAVVLCEEIFDNIRKISCPVKTALPDITLKLSKNVCKDIGALQDSVPEGQGLLKRLTDTFLCDLMCDSEFEKACQALLWSFEAQNLISKVASLQEPEQPIIPEDGGNINDNFKQDNTVDGGISVQNNVNLENGKQNAGEGKGLNEVLAHDDIGEVPGLHKLKDTAEQKSAETANLGKKERQDQPIVAKEPVLKNQIVPNAGSGDLAGTSKSTSNSKTSSPLSQQSTVTSNVNTEVQPMEDAIKSESIVQDMKNQPQSDITNMPVETDPKDSLSKGSKTNVATGAAQTVIVNTLDKKQVVDKKVNKPPEKLLPDNYIPANPNIPVNGDDGPNNEIVDEMPHMSDQNSNFHNNNELPHELGSSNEASADLNNKKNPSNLVDTHAKSKLQNTVDNDGKLVEKTDVPTTGSQTLKDTTTYQTLQEEYLDKTKTSKDEIKANQPETDTGSRKVETQDLTKADTITDGGNEHVSTDQKQTEVAQQTGKSNNTIPDATETSFIVNENVAENSLKSKDGDENSGGKSVVPSSLSKSSIETTVALENMESDGDFHQPANEEVEHFGDLENTEEDYPKQEYGDGLYEVPKNKESNPDVPKESITNQNENPNEFPSGNSFGQDSNPIQMIDFPEQDSHFFFYFLSIVLILMAGYLIFHNKQKIIALIVEGRHERNRRSHRIGYKKLETK